MSEQRHEVQIDTEIASQFGVYSRAVSATASIQKRIDWYNEKGRTIQADAQLDRLYEAKAIQQAALNALKSAEAAYGGWSRFFLVQASNGHIHRDMSCSTCFLTTQYAWLPELSGLSEAEAVNEYGSILCSICYPSAPVEWTNGENKKEAARKAADKAERELYHTPEGKRFKSALKAVDSKQYRVNRFNEDLTRLANERGNAPEWIVRDAERAVAELPKARKQLASAEAKLSAAFQGLVK